ncbi:MAG TPA: Hsp33 family molecular chaperone HslO [Alphaproteobacteria bacterium]
MIQPFQIDRFDLRGRLVRLGPAIDTILTRHAYAEPVGALLGEAVALACVLAAAMKYDGIFTLQTKSDGPVRLLVADVTSDGALRGYAEVDPARLKAALDGPIENPVPRLLGAGYLAFTVDQGPDTERYQGIVDLTGATLADCAHHYFRQSEQLDAAIRLAAARDAKGRWRAGAMMIQRLPGADLDDWDIDGVEDGWRRALTFMGTATAAELVDPLLAPNDLLFRLFHEDGVRAFRPRPLAARCRCSRKRVAEMLSRLPRDEVLACREPETGEVVVTCQFCNTDQRFTLEQLEALYAGR